MPIVSWGLNSGDTFGLLDTRLTESDPTTNHSSNDFINAGDYGTGDHITSALKPDIAAFVSSLSGSNISINDFYFELNSDSAISTTGNVFNFYECLQPIVITEATWDDFQALDAWNTGGGRGAGVDRSTTPLATLTITEGSGYDSASGAALNAWLLACVNEAHANNGIISDTGSIANAQGFWGSSQAPDGFRPRFVLNYSIVSSNVDLTVSDSSHGHAADNTALTQANQLLVDEALHSSSVDNTDLTQANSLSLDECLHSTYADNVFLTLPGNVTVVQYKFTLNTFDDVLTVTLDNPVTSGNSIVMLFERNPDFDTGTDPAFDDQSNTFAHVIAASNTHIFDTKACELFYKHNITNSPQTFSVPWDDAGSHLSNLVVMEVSGLANAAPVDIVEGSAAGSDSNTTSLQVTLDTVTENSLLIGYASNLGAVISGASGTFVDSQSGTDDYNVLLYKTTTAAGANTLDATQSGSQRYSLFAWAFDALGTDTELVVNDATHSHNVENAVLTQNYSLTVQDCSHSNAADNFALTQANSLVLQDALHSSLADNIELGSTSFTLTVADSNHANSVDNLALTVSYILITSIETGSDFVITAFPDAEVGDLIELTSVIGGVLADVNIYSNLTFDAAENVLGFFVRIWDADDQTWSEPVAQYFNIDLFVQESLHSQASDNVSVTVQFTLTVADCTHSHSVDNLSLVQANSLVVSECSHSHTVDLVSLTQNTNLVVSDSTHSNSCDNVSLTQANILAVQETSHSNVCDSVLLVQQNTLSIQESLHSTSAESVVLSNAVILNLADCLHSSSCENIVLSQANNLLVQDCLHSNSVDNTALLQANLITVSDCVHSLASDNLIVDLSFSISLSDCLHSHSADSIILNTSSVIAVQDCLNSHNSDNLSLTQFNNLIVQESIHSTTADALILILYLNGPPDEARRISFAAEVRQIVWTV